MKSDVRPAQNWYVIVSFAGVLGFLPKQSAARNPGFSNIELARPVDFCLPPPLTPPLLSSTLPHYNTTRNRVLLYIGGMFDSMAVEVSARCCSSRESPD
jgi:hypothetical protein